MTGGKPHLPSGLRPSHTPVHFFASRLRQLRRSASACLYLKACLLLVRCQHNFGVDKG
jgi:hypothetical protein